MAPIAARSASTILFLLQGFALPLLAADDFPEALVREAAVASTDEKPGEGIAGEPEMVARLERAPLAQGFVGEVEPNGTAAEATPLGGSDVVGLGYAWPASDVDFWSFSAGAGDRVYAAIMTSAAQGSTNSLLDVVDVDGSTVLETDDDDGSFTSTASSIAGTVLPSAGTYYLVVRQDGTSTMRPYHLHFRLQSGAPDPETEPNDTFPGEALPPSGWVSGDLSALTDVDYFSFALNAGDTIFASLDLDPERDSVEWNGQLAVAIFGGFILTINDGGTASPDSEAHFMTAQDAGTYAVRVNVPTGGTTFGTYRLSVSIIPAVDQGTNCTTYTSVDPPQVIPDGPGMITSTITVPGNPRIADLDVSIQLDHLDMTDLDVHLVSPAGNDNGLFSDIGNAAQPTMDITLDDEAGVTINSYNVVEDMVVLPELAYRLSWFDGEDGGGTWTLVVRDDAAADGGNLTGWSLRICEPAEEPPACPAETIPVTVYSSDFEADDGGFTHSGVEDEWERGLPTFDPLTTCNSGVNCWVTDLDDFYNPNSSQDLVSSPINLTGLVGPVVVSWNQRYHLESATFDHFFVDVQEVGGANPERLFEWLDGTMNDSVGNPSTAIRESAGWALVEGRADGFAGQPIELRFHVDSDATAHLVGVAIDDVAVTACLPEGDFPIADITPSSFSFEIAPDSGGGDTLNVGNIGTADLIWTIAEAADGATCGSPVDIPWLSASPTGGTTTPAGTVPVTVTVNTTGLAIGIYEAALCVSSNDFTGPLEAVPVTLTVLGATADVTPASFEFEVFEGGADGGTLDIGNLGTADLDWSLAEAATDCGAPLDVPWLSAAPTSGTVAPAGSAPVDVTVDSTGLAVGDHTAILCLTTNDPDAALIQVPVLLTVVATPIIEVVPDELVATVERDAIDTGQLAILNQGSGVLDWSILLDGAGIMPTRRGGASRFLRSIAGLDWDAGEGEATAAPATAQSADDAALGIDRSAPTASPRAPRITGPIRGQLVEDGVLLVPQPTNERIMALDPDTGVLLDADFINYGAIGTLGTLLHVVAHPDGQRLLVSSQTQDVVHAFDVDGNYLGVFAPAGGADPAIMDNIRGMAFHPQTGNLLVTSSGGTNVNTVVEFDLEGNFLGVFIASGAGGMSSPWSLIFRETDALLSGGIGDNIYSYQHDGTFIEVWQLGINFPEQIVEVGSGNVLAAEFSTPSGVWELDADGNLVAVYDPVTGNRGVFELSNGNILTSNASGVHEISRANLLVETEVAGSSQMIGYVKTLDCSIPEWLSVDPQAGSTAPAGFSLLTVTYDATGLEPGQYTAGICIESNDPAQPIVQVPVTLTVVLPPDFATLRGTVESLGYCGANPEPLAGATVEIVGAEATYPLVTDGNGFYEAFLPDSESPVSINVSAAGHLPANLTGVAFGGGDLVTNDFALALAAPCATATPADFSFAVAPDGTASDTLTIGNVAGAAGLDWTIVTAVPTVVAGAASEPPGGGPAGAGAVAGAAMDLASLLGAPLPGLRPINPLGAGVDCNAAPGLVLHDDGSIENGYSGNPASGVTEVRFVDKFTPSAYPGTFLEVCVSFITLAGGPNSLNFDIVVFDDDGADGAPGTLLGSLPATATGIPVGIGPPTWFSYDISSLNLAIESGSVYIGARWAPPAPVNVFISSDESVGNPAGFAGGYWWNNNANAWVEIETPTAFPDYRSLFVRAVERVIDCANPELIPWLSVTPSAGSTPAGGSSAVEVSVDATGLAVGLYEAGLCVATSDPLQPLLVIPVSLTVLDTMPFLDGFESGDTSAWSFTVP